MPQVLISFDFDHPASQAVPHATLDALVTGGGIDISAFLLASSRVSSNQVQLRAHESLPGR